LGGVKKFERVLCEVACGRHATTAQAELHRKSEKNPSPPLSAKPHQNRQAGPTPPHAANPTVQPNKPTNHISSKEFKFTITNPTTQNRRKSVGGFSAFSSVMLTIVFLLGLYKNLIEVILKKFVL
jgi:hypothetical protein